MRVYLVRHGVAVDKSGWAGPDEDRPLTTDGRSELVALLRDLKHDGDRPPKAIWTSPLVRAVQTAEACACIWAKRASVEVHRSLLSEAKPSELVDELEKATIEGPLALVGHEPQLGKFLAHVLGRDGKLELPKGSVARLRWKEHRNPKWEFVTLRAPDLTRIVTDLSELC